MIGLNFAAAKSGFFDRSAVVKAMDKTNRANLSKFGAFTRTAGRSSLRSTKKISRPGMPPASHVGTVKKLLFFAYDPSRKSVVIGPVGSKPDPKALRLLEEGGQDVRRGKTLIYRPRPFMGPAFEKTKKQLPEIWANSMR